MDNYKIRVNNEAESREAQELFFELGYEWISSKKCITNDKEIYADENGDLSSTGTYRYKFETISLPQLRDLVVLHRNDINDANWETEGDDQIYQDSSGKSFIFREQGWDELQRHEMRQAMWEKTKPKPQTTENEQGLISGADALRALADGEDVLWKADSESIADAKRFIEHPPYLALALHPNCNYQFWIKPRTVKLEIEVPAPFEPEFDERFFFIDSNYPDGFNFSFWQGRLEEKCRSQFGVYRTEAEIKIVVEQLRKLKEPSQ